MKRQNNIISQKLFKMKTILVSFLLLFLCFNLIIVSANDKEISLSDISIGEHYDYGNALFNTNLVKGTCTMQDGKPIGLTVVPGTPTLLNIFDLNEGKLIDVKTVPNASSAAWMNDTNSDGDVFFGTYTKTRLYRYSPKTKELTDFGPIGGEGALISMCFDEDNNVYMGTYPSAKILKFDVQSEKIIDLGRMSQSEQYLQALAYKDGNLYYQFMDNNEGLYKYDLKTSERSVIPFQSNTIKKASKMFTRDNYIVMMAISTDDKSVLMNYDTQKQEWGLKYGENVKGQYITPMLDDEFYYLDNSYINSFNTKTKQIKKLDNMKYGSFMRGNGWFELDDPEFLGMNYMNVQYSGDIQIWNFQTQKMKTYSDILQGVASETRAHYFGPDGRLYVGEYMGTKAAAVDLDTNEIELFHMSQPEGICVLDDKMYFGNYTSAELYILDTSKPYDRYMNKNDPSNNPRIWGSIGHDQDRPFCMIAAGDKVAMGTVPGYGSLGGALSIYDPATDKVDVYRNLVQDQMPVSMAYKDNKLYVGTSVSGGLGIYPTEQDAKVFIFNMETREVEKEITLKIPGISTPIKGVEGISIAPDNTILGYGRNYAYKLDIETLELIDFKIFNGPSYGNGMQIWKPYQVNYDPITGYAFIAIEGKLAIMDPLTMEYIQTDTPYAVSSVWGPDNNLYYIGKGSKIMMIPVIRGNDYTYKFKNKTILKIDNNKAIINGEMKEIDENNLIVPYYENGRTMVPLRFLIENMGLSVTYNPLEDKAIIYKEDLRVVIKPGSRDITINGIKEKIITPPTVKDDRTFVHIRTFSELFDRKVYWSEKGIIIMNNDGSEFDLTEDKDVIEYAEEYYNKEV